MMEKMRDSLKQKVKQTKDIQTEGRNEKGCNSGRRRERHTLSERLREQRRK